MSTFSLQVVIQAIAKTALGKELTDNTDRWFPILVLAISQVVPTVGEGNVQIIDQEDIDNRTELPKVQTGKWCIREEYSLDAMTSDSEKAEKAARPKRGRQERPKLPGCPFVLISPIIPDHQPLQHFYDVITEIPLALNWKANSSTTLKIHVGKSDGYSLQDLQRIAKCYLKYEYMIDQIHAQGSRKAFNYKKRAVFQSCYESATSYFGESDLKSLMAGIDAVSERRDVIAAVNRDWGMDGMTARSYKVNFTGVNEESGEGTIEFGQGVGTVDPNIISSWMDFCIEFVNRAVSLQGEEEDKLWEPTMTLDKFIPKWNPPNYPAPSGDQDWANESDDSDRDDSSHPESSFYVGAPKQNLPSFLSR